MKLRKFIARDARMGLELIRKELGPDAVVVTSRKTAQGVEFVAGCYEELAERADSAPSTTLAEASVEGGGIRRELTKLRALLQNQLAGLAWGMDKRRSPVRVHVMQSMLSAGFSPQLSRLLAARMPRNFSPPQADVWLRQVLIQNLAAFEASSLPGSQAGVWALVGPTGHGKTTTLAKLAARAALKHGPDHVALVSIDAYRVGARQQLSGYAEMMGVHCVLLDSAAELGQSLASLAGKRCVFIDTAGFGHADPKHAQQLASLGRLNAACILTLAASTQGPVAAQILRHHGGMTLAGVALTKLDEGGQWAPVLDCVVRAKLPVACLASGQRVPEDLHVAKPAYLIDRALRSTGQGAFAMNSDDWPVLAGARIEAEALGKAGVGP